MNDMVGATGEWVLGQLDGITIVMVSVERSATSLALHLACPANDVTRELDARYAAGFDAWAAELRAARDRGERGPDAPEQPSAFLNDLPLILADDVGTVYAAPRKQ